MTIPQTAGLRTLIQQHPPRNAGEVWDSAIEAALDLPSMQRSKTTEPSPAQKIARLRDQLKGELVAFHERLLIEPYRGDDFARSDGETFWTVKVPLTLFPKRDQGFTHVECILELSSEGDAGGFRVLQVLPEGRSDVLARAELGASLDLETNAKLGLSLPVAPEAKVVSTAAAQVYGRASANFVYEARRVCVESEIVAGTGARWRLDDVSKPERVGVESHQLAVVLKVQKGAPPLHAAGFLQAYSETKWITAAVGSVWQNLKDALRKFFKGGAPIEAYGEWRDILATRS
jgi:hypothetical protein